MRAQAITPQGAICSACYSHRHSAICDTCGRVDRPYTKGNCAHCVLRERLTEALTGPTGLPPCLVPLITDLVADKDPRSMLVWLLKPGRRQALAELADLASDGALTHERLDDKNGNLWNLLRARLVASQILPDRDPDLARLERWVARFLGERTPSQKLVLKPYARWSVLAAELDRWLSERRLTTRYTVKGFLEWTAPSQARAPAQGSVGARHRAIDQHRRRRAMGDRRTPSALHRAEPDAPPHRVLRCRLRPDTRSKPHDFHGSRSCSPRTAASPSCSEQRP
jgi:hypothetical protein